MGEKQPKFAMWFHNFMIWFALFAGVVAAVAYGVRYISYAVESRPRYMALTLIVGILMILLGLFVLKARFDLAAFRSRAPKELLICGLAAAAIVLILHWIEYISGDDYTTNFLTALILACWGIGLFRYYSLFKDRFVN